MTKPSRDNKIPAADLVIVIEWFDDIPSSEEVNEILDKAREYASVKSAKFRTLRLTEKDLA